MELVIVLVSIIGLVLYIWFSDPKPIYDETWTQGKGSLLFHSSLKPDNYPSTKEVFKTLDDARIKPCFLEADINK